MLVERDCRGSLIDRTVVHRPENASLERCASHPVKQAHRESRDRRQRIGRRDAAWGDTLARRAIRPCGQKFETHAKGESTFVHTGATKKAW